MLVGIWEGQKEPFLHWCAAKGKGHDAMGWLQVYLEAVAMEGVILFAVTYQTLGNRSIRITFVSIEPQFEQEITGHNRRVRKFGESIVLSDRLSF